MTLSPVFRRVLPFIALAIALGLLGLSWWGWQVLGGLRLLDPGLSVC